MKNHSSPVIDLCARLAAATARAEAMLNVASQVGVDLRKMNEVRRRLIEHEHEYDRAVTSSRRAELVRLIAADIEILAGAYKRLEATVHGTATT
jgi:hypothetical protein